MSFDLEKFVSKKIGKSLPTNKYFSINIAMILLGLILLFGFYIRIVHLDVPTFWVDESISSNAAAKILTTGTSTFDSGAYYSRAQFFHFSQSISMMIFGINDFAARIPSIIFGLLTIVLAYLFGKEISGKKSGGLMVATFCAVFFLEVFYSKQARFYQLFQLLFFATIYFSYKAKQNFNYIYLAILSLFLAIDTQIAGILVAPVLLYPIVFNKKFDLKKVFLENKLNLIIFLGIFLFVLSRVNSALNISTSDFELTYFYASSYFSFFSHLIPILVFSVIGLVFSYKKNKELTILLVAPSILLLLLVLLIDLFAFRYIYFITLLLIIFCPLMFHFLAEKYDKLLIIVFFVMIFLTSNIFNPFIYTSVLTPIERNFNDFSAPEINYKDIPGELLSELKSEDSKIITLFSPHVEWYIKKPSLVMPFSMSGKGTNTINYYNAEIDQNVDVYSGAPFITQKPISEFYFIGDTFSLSKLKPAQIDFLNSIIDDCVDLHKNNSIVIKKCN